MIDGQLSRRFTLLGTKMGGRASAVEFPQSSQSGLDNAHLVGALAVLAVVLHGELQIQKYQLNDGDIAINKDGIGDLATIG